MAPPQLVLKKNAQVMLIKNMDELLVNGSMGRVIGFCEKESYRIDRQGHWAGDGELSFDSGDEGGVDENGQPTKKRKLGAVGAKRGELLPVVTFKLPSGTQHAIVTTRSKTFVDPFALNRCNT